VINLLASTPDPVCVLFIGESNSGGTAPNASATAGELLPRPEVKILNNTTLALQTLQVGVNNLIGHAGLTDNATHGWEIGLANEVAAGNWTGRSAVNPVYLLKAGQGGSLIGQWADGLAYMNTFKSRWDAFAAAVPNASRMRLAIWMTIGINDYYSATPATTFRVNLLNWIDRIRSYVGIPDAPVLFMGYPPGLQSYQDQIDILARTAIDFYNVSSAGLTLNGSIHWDYAGYKEGAARLVAATISHPAPPA